MLSWQCVAVPAGGTCTEDARGALLCRRAHQKAKQDEPADEHERLPWPLPRVCLRFEQFCMLTMNFFSCQGVQRSAMLRLLRCSIWRCAVQQGGAAMSSASCKAGRELVPVQIPAVMLPQPDFRDIDDCFFLHSGGPQNGRCNVLRGSRGAHRRGQLVLKP